MLLTVVEVLAICLIILFSVLGNLLVVLSVLMVEKLREPANLLLLSLAVTDLLISFFVMPGALTSQLYGGWPLSQPSCLVWIFADVFLCTSSILTLTAICVDRYYAITYSLHYPPVRTNKLLGVAIICIQITAGLVSAPALVTSSSGLVTEYPPTTEPISRKPNCSQLTTTTTTTTEMTTSGDDLHFLDFHDQGGMPQCLVSQSPAYQLYATMCSFYLPLIVMVILYTKIYITARKIIQKERKSPYPNRRFTQNDTQKTRQISTNTEDRNSGQIAHLAYSEKMLNGESSHCVLTTPDPQELVDNRFQAADTQLNNVDKDDKGEEESDSFIPIGDTVDDESCIQQRRTTEDSSQKSDEENIERRQDDLIKLSNGLWAEREFIEREFPSMDGQSPLITADPDQHLHNIRELSESEPHCTVQVFTASEVLKISDTLYCIKLPMDSKSSEGAHHDIHRASAETEYSDLTREPSECEDVEGQQQRRRFGEVVVDTDNRHHHHPVYGDDGQHSTQKLESLPISISECSGLTAGSIATASTIVAVTPLLERPDQIKPNQPGIFISGQNVDRGIVIKARVPLKKSLSLQRFFSGVSQSARQEWKATLTVGIVLFTFIVCWLPFFVLALYTPLAKHNKVPDWVYAVAQWLGYANSMFNPIIYGVLHRDFRKTFADLLCCKCCSSSSAHEFRR